MAALPVAEKEAPLVTTSPAQAVSRQEISNQSSEEAKVPSTTETKPAAKLKFKTITNYSYFESGTKWVKVLLPDLENLEKHPQDKINVEFLTPRSFSVRVFDYKG